MPPPTAENSTKYTITTSLYDIKHLLKVNIAMDIKPQRNMVLKKSLKKEGARKAIRF
jgi:hypothetical protein